MGQKISSCIHSCGSCSNSVSPSYWNYEKLIPQPDDSFNLQKHPQDCEKSKKSHVKDSFNLQKHPQDCEKLKKPKEKDDSVYLQIHPQELHFPFELRKEISCTLRLSNKSDHYVAFKVRTTAGSKKYWDWPNNAVLKPKFTCDITVTLLAQDEALPHMQCKDTFLIRSIVVRPGTTAADITSEMFKKESGYEVKEHKLRVVYVAPPPKPTSVFSDQTRELISKLTKERNFAIEENKRLQKELKLLKREANKDYPIQ